MGWGRRLFAVIVGLAAFTVGLWPVGALCFLYLAISLRRKKHTQQQEKVRSRVRSPLRHVAAGGLVLLAVIALVSGGTISPLAFLGSAIAVLMWPSLPRALHLSEMAPQSNSVLLRSKRVPIEWCSLAELKPGAEDFPRAVSSFAGTLLVFTDTGKAYAMASCRALSRKEAEARVLSEFRSAALSAGSYLLPLDSETAAEVLRARLSRTKKLSLDLAESASSVSGALLLECSGGSILRAAAFEMEGTAPEPSIPQRPDELGNTPLLWEVLDSVGKRTRWPEPDAVSNLLESMLATRGEPIAERVRSLEGTGSRVTAESLAGEAVQLSRPQLRAIVTIYS